MRLALPLFTVQYSSRFRPRRPLPTSVICPLPPSLYLGLEIGRAWRIFGLSVTQPVNPGSHMNGNSSRIPRQPHTNLGAISTGTPLEFHVKPLQRKPLVALLLHLAEGPVSSFASLVCLSRIRPLASISL